MTIAYTTKIGHTHLKVCDLQRSIDFYTRFLGLNVTEIALQHVGPDAPSPPPNGTGLYHVAFEVPDKHVFALAYLTLIEAGISVATVDHYISWAMYFDDPDGNGLEIYWDTRGQPGGRNLWHGDNAILTDETILAALEA